MTDFAHPDFVAEWKALQRELWTTEMTTFNFDTCLYRKDGGIMWAHVTTILIEDNLKTLGYTILEDISVKKEVERLKKQVREQQRQQIAEVILNTQEAERKRISESLHNGLSQLLYGVKLSLSQIEADMARLKEPDKSALAYTEKLLNDSIQECRRVSHELIPVILEDYGIREAIETICRQLSNGVRFGCSFKGSRARLDRFLEIAVYRTVQELLLNVVKHAEATEARAEIVVGKTDIRIRVDDNGKGFPPSIDMKEGIGLQSIRQKLQVLSGAIKLLSNETGGTRVEIRIPKRVN
jgi:signal transduction histidine kinase